MIGKSEKLLVGSVAFFGACGVVAVGLSALSGAPEPPRPAVSDPRPVLQPVSAGTLQDMSGPEWFASMGDTCTPKRLTHHEGWDASPRTNEGAVYRAACLALAADVQGARAEILSLPVEERFAAANVLFSIGHPRADAGDEVAAGPLMEVVAEFAPNNYMALYHAGAALFEFGDAEAAKPYLERFLQEYAQEDGWRAEAVRMLEASAGRSR